MLMTARMLPIQAKRKGTTYQPSVKKKMHWGYWTQMKAEEALNHLKQVVFEGLSESFGR